MLSFLKTTTKSVKTDIFSFKQKIYCFHITQRKDENKTDDSFYTASFKIYFIHTLCLSIHYPYWKNGATMNEPLHM